MMPLYGQVRGQLNADQSGSKTAIRVYNHGRQTYGLQARDLPSHCHRNYVVQHSICNLDDLLGEDKGI